MDELMKIQRQNFDGEEMQAIDAIELYEFLEIKTRYNDWISRKIEDAQLVENKDYIIYSGLSKLPGPKPKQYIISIDSAKHISMMERNEKGKEAREYFIKVEKQARQMFAIQTSAQQFMPQAQLARVTIEETLRIGDLLKCPVHLAQIEAVKKAEEISGIDYSHMLTTSKAMDDIQEHELFLEPSDIATRIGIDGTVQMRGRRVNAMLYEIGLQEKIAGSWEPVEQLRGKNVVIKHAWKKGGKSGYNLKWNVDFVIQQLEQEGLA